MSIRLQQDLQRLDALAFHRREWSETEMIRYHEIREDQGDAAVQELEGFYRWMFVPISLWPFNIQEVFAIGLARIFAGKPLDREMCLLLEMLPDPPSEAVCAVVADHEHQVQRGHYEELVTTTAKFDAVEKEAELDMAITNEWQRIKETWDVDRYRDDKGVIRRTFSPERNLRVSFSVNWQRRAGRFQAVFDAFCLRWNLYGMQGDRPLLMKLSVNLTPHGTMIFIPAYWSFDARRDVRWKAVMKLHRVRATRKQGPVLTEGLEERRELAGKLKSLDREAGKKKLRGQKRHDFLCQGLGLVIETDPKRIARLRKEFP